VIKTYQRCHSGNRVQNPASPHGEQWGGGRRVRGEERREDERLEWRKRRVKSVICVLEKNALIHEGVQYTSFFLICDFYANYLVQHNDETDE
jgi:hypothetical protein